MLCNTLIAHDESINQSTEQSIQTDLYRATHCQPIRYVPCVIKAKFHYAILLASAAGSLARASRSVTCLRAGHRPASELEFGLSCTI